MFRIQPFVLNLFVVVLLAGCDTKNTDGPDPEPGDDDDDDDDDDDGILQIPMTVNCHEEGACTPVMTVSYLALHECFEPDCVLYPENDCWPPGTPGLIAENCDATLVSEACTIYGDPYEATLSTDPLPADCVCSLQNIGDLNQPVGGSLEELCCIDEEKGFLDAFAEEIAALDNCEVDYHVANDFCDPDEDATWQVCNPLAQFRISPNAEFVLYINPSLSYISLDTPIGDDTVAVGGGGSARTGPDSFLTATIAADSATLGSQSYTEWLWWMSAPLDIDVSAGIIEVPMDNDVPFFGKGKLDSERYRAEIYMGDDASGTINPMNHTWALDFTQNSLGWLVEIHLEGAYEDVP